MSKQTTEQFQILLKKVVAGDSLSQDEAEQVIDLIDTGEVPESAIAGFLTALSCKGETVNEICGLARGMRKKSLTVPRQGNEPLIDLCGTGGDGVGTFNISTITSFVVAGAGLTVSKHGNRAITSSCGSADLLEALGMNLNMTPKQVGACLDEVGIAFLFAPAFHPAMKYIMPARKALGFRTIFNILGPLLSPVNANYQLMGVFENGLTEKVAKVFVELGTEAGMVVHGDGIDEITLTGSTQITEFNTADKNDSQKELKDESINNYDFLPEKYGFKRVDHDALKGGSAEENVEIAKKILKANSSNGPGDPHFDVVIVNSAAALKVAGMVADFKAGIEQAKESIFSGKAYQKLEELISFSNKIIIN